MDQTAWDERYAGPELVWGLGPNCFVAEELATLPPGRAIDLGTGEGRNAIWLAERGFTVTAVDFSQVGLARAAGLAAERRVSVDWVHADLLDYQPRRAATTWC
jgi:2-polyprenyl-3-methyl-5-hydroxy-6-metoxy-1,4-benzoquinol methylase